MWWRGALVVFCAGCGGSSGGSPFVGASADAMATGAASNGDDASESPVGADAATVVGSDSGGFAFADSFAGTADCVAGDYVGTYQGTNDSSKLGGPTNFPISGPMDFDLIRMDTATGENDLVTNDGMFEMTWGGTTTGDAATGLIVVQAAVSGQLNCSTDSFSAMSTSATWTLIGINAGTANLTFSGTYDAASQTISGMFNVTDSLSTSMGTWSVTLTPAGDP